MLHLEPRVDLQEIELARLVEEELHRPGIHISGGLGGGDRRLSHGLPEGRGERRRGRLFDDLLVAALDGTFPLQEVDHVSLPVGQDLEFDMAGLLEILLQVDIAVSEGAPGFACGREGGLPEFTRGPHDPHPLPAAAGRGLDDDRIADLLGLAGQDVGIRLGLHHAGDDRDVAFDHDPPRDGLVPQVADGPAGRADEDHPLLLAPLRKEGILRQKPVAGMDGLGAGLFGRCHDAFDVEVALGRLGGTEADRLVRFEDVEGVPVRLGIDGHGPDAHFPAGGDDPHGNLAPVGDEYLVKHRQLLHKSSTT